MGQERQVNQREPAGAAGTVRGAAEIRAESPAQAAEPPDARPAKRPNILLIITDEHNAGVMGCAGNKIIQTANLDSLAQRGVTFDNCYCNSPLCVPSRHSMTACRYVSRVGVWNNDCWLPSDDIPSIARVMTEAGYDSLLCGRMHYDYSRRYGFREIGEPLNDHYAAGKGGRRTADNLTEGPGYSNRFDQFKPGESPMMASDQNVTTNAIQFLKKRPAGDKPFFMICGYWSPHFPLIVPQAYYEAYRDRVPMPHIPPGSVAAQVLNYQHLRVGFHLGHVPQDVVKRGRELYYGLTQWIDEQIGLVLDALAASAVGQDTVVIYTSDHGENMGEHGLWWKNCMYEHAARVPLIVSHPQRWPGGQRRQGACSLVDMVQTVADVGGAKTPQDWNGRSLAPWLDDPQTKWKDTAVSEYYGHNIASGYAMIRQGDYKYVYHSAADERHPAQRELYSLKNDPGELTNLAGAAPQRDRVAAMHQALVMEIGESPDQTEVRCRADGARGYERKDPRPTGQKQKMANTK